MNPTFRLLSRRNLLSSLVKYSGAALVAPKLVWSLPGTGYAPKLSVEGYIWTQHFSSQKETLAAGEDEALRDTHLAGYKRIELASDFFKPAVREHTRELLAKFNLSPESVYAGTTLHEVQAAETSIKSVLELADFLMPLGTKVMITNPSPKPDKQRKSDDELKTQAHYINQLGGALQHRGMKLLLHHHTPELRDNAREWWFELQNTDPALVGCCMDVHWAYRGGQEVMPFLQKVGPRIESLHLRNSQHGIWMEEFGPGDVDYAKVARYLHQIDYRGFLVVELAYDPETVITRSLEEDLRRSRVYTEQVFGLKTS